MPMRAVMHVMRLFVCCPQNCTKTAQLRLTPTDVRMDFFWGELGAVGAVTYAIGLKTNGSAHIRYAMGAHTERGQAK